MSKSNDLTEYAEEGYHSTATNAYLASSPAWYALEIGRYLQATGRSMPRDVRMGRGYRIWANDMLFAFDNDRIKRIK